MPFMFFERVVNEKKKTFYRWNGKHYKLAGDNLIKKAWEKKGKLMNIGWHVTANELIRLYTDGAHDDKDRRLVIDCDPNSTSWIGFAELLDVYAFTWEDEKGCTDLTLLMFRLRNLHYEKYGSSKIRDQMKEKAAIRNHLPEPTDWDEKDDFFEFLYLKNNWNWGKSGRTNAAFLDRKTLSYFKRFF